MKKLLYIITLFITLSSCDKYSKVHIPVYKANPSEDKKFGEHTPEEINAYLDSMNAEGVGLIIRGSDREYDTIIDHVHYIYIKEE